MSSKIYVFRHTQSTDNEFSIFSGDRNVDLSNVGYSEAELLADKLKDKNINLAYTSNLSRSIETMSVVLKHHPKVVVCIDERIRERSYGWMEGQSKTQWAKYAYPIFKILHRSYYIPPPGGESLYQVRQRVRVFLNELVTYLSDKSLNVAICIHSGSIRGIREYFEHISEDDLNKIETQEGQLFEYEVTSKE